VDREIPRYGLELIEQTFAYPRLTASVTAFITRRGQHGATLAPFDPL